MMRPFPGSEKAVRRVGGVLKWAWAIGWTGVWATIGLLSWPLSPSGRLYLWCARTWSRIALWGCRIEVVRIGMPDIDAGKPYVFMSSHESIFDIMALFIAIPCDVRMLSKVELRRIPILGWSMWMAGFVFIDRKSPASAKRSIDRAAELVRGGKSIVIFPEGTRGDGRDLLPFKKGGFVLAIQSGVPVVPVAIQGSAATLPKHTWFPRKGRIEVRFGAPIETSGMAADQRAALAERTRGVIQALKDGAPVSLAE
jgi:1-acyl-sn-glycerol-3-phosphate acyltransferase